MNGFPLERELPELTDHQVSLLDSICKAASGSTEGPFRALFYQYDKLSHEQGLDTSRDNAVYRWMLRVGEKARRDHKLRQPLHFVPYLRSLLEAQGITVVDDDWQEEDNIAVHSSDLQNHTTQDHRKSKPRRRVSFQDARMEETWLSERSLLLQPSPVDPPKDLLRQPPRRPLDLAILQRRGSVGSERDLAWHQPSLKHFQNASPSSGYTSDFEEPMDPELYPHPHQAVLDEDLAAWHTTWMRQKRKHWVKKCLKKWNERALVLRASHDNAYSDAAAQDRHRLLKESFDYWKVVSQNRKSFRAHLAILDDILANHSLKQNYQLLDKSFSHWHGSAVYQTRVNEHTRKQLLQKRYFVRWRNLAVENATRARSILVSKYIALWRERTIRHAIVRQQAAAHYEETLTRTCLRQWLWNWRERLVSGRHEVWMQRNVFDTLLDKIGQRNFMLEQAEAWRGQRVARSTLRMLTEERQQRQLKSAIAKTHCDHKLIATLMHNLSIQAKLRPLAATLSLKVAVNLQRKVLQVWQTRVGLCRQASEIDRKRVLQTAWTSWNDSLRCKALAQRIDERHLTESLRRWVMRTRGETFRRAQSARTLQRVLHQWRGQAQQHNGTLQQASTKFAENQHWRRLKYGLLRLAAAVRYREDAGRAATEFSNSRALPDVLEVWKQRSQNVRQLATWAADARFYSLCSKTFKIWQERTTEHKHQRRREAYVTVRSRIKIRIVRSCFDLLRGKLEELNVMKEQATDKAQVKLFDVGTAAFDAWRYKAAQYVELEIQAAAVDQRKLHASALTALVNHRVESEAMEEQAVLFRQQVDIALLASILRRVQWVNFTAARRRESADALCARNETQHMKFLLRHWANQSALKRAAKTTEQDPESPSLRPASRAMSRSMERPTRSTSPARTTTPAYMRTPSRSRRVGRFRPLPTPAHVTPMLFDQGYYVTTPAPLLDAQHDDGGESHDIFDGLTAQITPFARKLRAGGIMPVPPSALKSSVLGRSVAGTGKSVRFAGSSRFGRGQRGPGASGG